MGKMSNKIVYIDRRAFKTGRIIGILTSNACRNRGDKI